MSNPVVVEVLRGDRLESAHRGAGAVVDADGWIAFAFGDVDRPIYPRSAVKALQALPLIESGAADLMLRYGVKRLPVLRGEAVVGIISRSDLLKALVAALPKADGGHPDAEIKAAIEAELDRLGWAPKASIRVDAHNGVVTFDGAITDERLRSGLRVIAENTAGVTEVHDHMCWIEPNSGLYLPSEEEERDEPPKP